MIYSFGGLGGGADLKRVCQECHFVPCLTKGKEKAHDFTNSVSFLKGIKHN